ncbi:MAG TPA: hypothetical protein VIG66_09915 [Noviherbaspirillum sp.]
MILPLLIAIACYCWGAALLARGLRLASERSAIVGISLMIGAAVAVGGILERIMP